MGAISVGLTDMTGLQISVLGGFSAYNTIGKRVTIANRKACAMLAYLALNQSPVESRERLAGMFWSDRAENQARASLRQCIKQLREIFDEENLYGFYTERQAVGLSSAVVDLQVVAQALKEGVVAKELLSAEVEPEKLLYGFESLDQSFTAWLHVARQHWRDTLVSGLEQCLKEGDKENSRDAAKVLMRIDPSHEDACRHLIKRDALEGNTASALRRYNELWAKLDEEYDVEPDQETQTLIARIKTGTFNKCEDQSSSPAPATATATEAKDPVPDSFSEVLEENIKIPVIVVSSFVQEGPWTQETYLIEGFRRELIASLARFREWVTVEGFGTNELQNTLPAQAGSPISNYQLDCGYREEGDNVHLVITLKDIVNRTYIWSEQLNLTLNNWFSVQKQIVRRIALAFNVNLTAQRISKISTLPQEKLPIYDKWLRGQSMVFGFKPDNWRNAHSIFTDITNLNEGFSPAYSSLAQLENSVHLAFPGTFRTQQTHDRALQLAQRSVELDPLDTRSHLSHGWALALNGHFDRAQMSFKLACELNQNAPWTLVSAALGIAFSDSREEALQLADQSLALNPNPSKLDWGYQATLRFVCADYDGCVKAVDSADGSISNLSGWKAAALSQLGYREEARASGEQFVQLMNARWTGDKVRNSEEVANWFLHCFPIRNHDTWLRLRDGLAGAGIEVSDIRHPRLPD